ncbi:hypothetical protein [Sporolactobacillus inulinus]|nr:hypothetical protein [Sporolactobacillus inulinus]
MQESAGLLWLAINRAAPQAPERFRVFRLPKQQNQNDKSFTCKKKASLLM